MHPPSFCPVRDHTAPWTQYSMPRGTHRGSGKFAGCQNVQLSPLGVPGSSCRLFVACHLLPLPLAPSPTLSSPPQHNLGSLPGVPGAPLLQQQAACARNYFLEATQRCAGWRGRMLAQARHLCSGVSVLVSRDTLRRDLSPSPFALSSSQTCIF